MISSGLGVSTAGSGSDPWVDSGGVMASGSSTGCSSDWLWLSEGGLWASGKSSGIFSCGIVSDSCWDLWASEIIGSWLMVGISLGICMASWEQTGLTCSGAVKFTSMGSPNGVFIFLIDYFQGPNQYPPWGVGCHIMTHSPGEYIFLLGLDRRRQALLKAMSLSVWWNAMRAFSLSAKLLRKLMPCASLRSALSRADSLSLLSRDPGNLELFPNTNTSGEKPFRMLSAFFACVCSVPRLDANHHRSWWEIHNLFCPACFGESVHVFHYVHSASAHMVPWLWTGCHAVAKILQTVHWWIQLPNR